MLNNYFFLNELIYFSIYSKVAMRRECSNAQLQSTKRLVRFGITLARRANGRRRREMAAVLSCNTCLCAVR